VLTSGAIELTSSNRPPIVIDKRGECLGHLALEGKSKRTATLRTTQPTKFWVLEGNFFHECLNLHRRQNQEKYLEHIDSIAIFSVLNRQEKALLASHATKNKFKPGTVIVREGDAGDLLYVIIKGQA
jgi:CRP-like cAMP-binding protein